MKTTFTYAQKRSVFRDNTLSGPFSDFWDFTAKDDITWIVYKPCGEKNEITLSTQLQADLGPPTKPGSVCSPWTPPTAAYAAPITSLGNAAPIREPSRCDVRIAASLRGVRVDVPVWWRSPESR
ncbi:hypothetical protein [Actinomadura graeca]